MSHLAQQQHRRASSCIGLAEDILTACDKDEIRIADGPKGKGQCLQTTKLHVPKSERGVEKMNSAAAFALYAIKHTRNASDNLGAGYNTVGDNVHFWIDPFDTDTVNFKAAKEFLRTHLRELFKEAKPPKGIEYNAEAEGPRPEGSYFIGPLSPHDGAFVDGVMGMILEFHGIKGIQSRTINMNDGLGTTYIDCDRAEMLSILTKESLTSQQRYNA